MNKPISLEVHHKDGDKENNESENLELLCPNCHSYTENYRGRKNGGLVESADTLDLESSALA